MSLRDAVKRQPYRLTWLDRAIGAVSPTWQVNRIRAKLAGNLMLRHYEGAGTGRRTHGWRRTSNDANQTIGPALATLRENARDLVRNNPYAESALTTIVDDTVGWGIMARAKDTRAMDTWRRWAETTACDADGRHDFFGLQKLVLRTIAESGECIVRRRLRRPDDGFPIPLQIQVLEPDYLDTMKDTLSLAGTPARIIQGVQFDGIGRRTGYWLFPEHPGSALGMQSSSFVPAESVLHLFKGTRAGQVRAPSWFAPVLLRFKDFDEFEDAQLMKQKIAACLAVMVTDIDGSATPLGVETNPEHPEIDYLEPGAIRNLAPGQDIKVVEPPKVGEYDAYARTVLRAIATGLGVTYEALTGDFNDMPFSAARMSKLQHEARIHDWRWRLMIPQFCQPVWTWAMEAAAIMGQVRSADVAVKWTPPPMPFVDPVNEGLAVQRNVRSGITTLPESIRERGLDPDEVFAEIAATNAKLDGLGIVLDCDPRKMTQAGQAQMVAKPGESPQPEADDEDIERAWALGWPRR